MILAGLDCGKKGALVVASFRPDGTGELLASWATDEKFVTSEDAYADGAMREALVEVLRLNPERVIVERQQAHPDDGVHSAFTTGQGYGLWLGLLRGLALRYALVHPLTWQTRTLPGPVGGNTKKRAAQLVHAQLPDLVPVMARDTKLRFHDGLADAGALCVHGFNTYGPNSLGLKRTA